MNEEIKYLKEHIAEEFSDVQVMLEQFKAIKNIFEKAIDEIEKGDNK